MKYLTVAEAAQRLGSTPKAIRQRIARQQLPYRKFGRKILIPLADLEAFLAALPGCTSDEALEAVEEAGRWR